MARREDPDPSRNDLTPDEIAPLDSPKSSPLPKSPSIAGYSTTPESSAGAPPVPPPLPAPAPLFGEGRHIENIEPGSVAVPASPPLSPLADAGEEPVEVTPFDLEKRAEKPIPAPRRQMPPPDAVD